MIVKQFTTLPDLSVKNMLLRLQIYHGLFFLNHKHHPAVGLLPKKQWISHKKSIFTESRRQGLQYQHTTKNENFASYLQNYWQHTKAVFLPKISPDLQSNASPCGFNGGLMGMLSYDQAAMQHINLHTPPPFPSYVAEYDIFLRQEGSHWVLYGPQDEALDHVYAHIRQQLQQEASDQTPLKLQQHFQHCWSVAEYQQAFAHVQHYLKSGDCYQVNLTQPFKAQAKGHLLSALDHLMALSNAPHAGYTRFGAFEVLSCSPELFIEFRPRQQFMTKPIKGTRPRHADALLDHQQKQALIASEKDRSENLMIVDLLRNDLGKYAETGSVKVTSLFHIESFAQVHHMVSDIEATLKAGSSPLQVLFDSLPGGSITGAPKIRAMQIIDELEFEARGAYCGSMGYLNYDDTGSFNILIRTLQKQGDTITAWAGGGITIASTCEAEYQECFDKISAILNCLNQYHSPDI